MTYQDYCAEAKQRGFVAMPEAAFRAWMAMPTHYIATNVPGRATPLMTPDPLAATPKEETWRDRPPLL